MKKNFLVANVRCEGCASTITKALCGRFSDIKVDLEVDPRVVSVEIKNEEDEAFLKETLRKLGYPLWDEKMGIVENAQMKAKSVISCAIGKFSSKKES